MRQPSARTTRRAGGSTSAPPTPTTNPSAPPPSHRGSRGATSWVVTSSAPATTSRRAPRRAGARGRPMPRAGRYRPLRRLTRRSLPRSQAPRPIGDRPALLTVQHVIEQLCVWLDNRTCVCYRAACAGELNLLATHLRRLDADRRLRRRHLASAVAQLATFRTRCDALWLQMVAAVEACVCIGLTAPGMRRGSPGCPGTARHGAAGGGVGPAAGRCPDRGRRLGRRGGVAAQSRRAGACPRVARNGARGAGGPGRRRAC